MRKHKWKINPEEIKEEDKVVLFITDTHLPFSKIEYLYWVKSVAVQYGANVIVHGGDLVDSHALSFHESEPDALGAETEFIEAHKMVQKYIKEFPYIYVTGGNHDRIPERKAASMGLSTRYLKSFSELYNLPDTWVVADHFIINGVKYEHGHKAKGGLHGAFNTAINNRMSTCVGHFHGNAGVKYQNNGDSIIFGLAGGCLLDNDTYAFRYGERAANKPVIGCSIIYNNKEAVFIPYEEEEM